MAGSASEQFHNNDVAAERTCAVTTEAGCDNSMCKWKPRKCSIQTNVNSSVGIRVFFLYPGAIWEAPEFYKTALKQYLFSDLIAEYKYMYI